MCMYQIFIYQLANELLGRFYFIGIVKIAAKSMEEKLPLWCCGGMQSTMGMCPEMIASILILAFEKGLQLFPYWQCKFAILQTMNKHSSFFNFNICHHLIS